MDKSSFASLPLAMALAALYDAVPALASVPAPEVPRMPRFDSPLSRKGGTFCWMSEMELESLTWWRDKKRESAQQGGQYAEKDEKTATRLDYWIKYRQVEPLKPYVGERNHRHETGAVPSASPKMHSWDNASADSKPASNYASDPDDDLYPEAAPF